MRGGWVVAWTVVGALLLAGPARADVTTPPGPTPATAIRHVDAGRVPAVLLREWRKSDNKNGCAPIWFDDFGAAEGGVARATYFGGGWGVVLDKKGLPGRGPGAGGCATCGRATVGVAGAGVVGSESDIARWQLARKWPSGIRAGYGLEGFTMGPDWLAYVLIPGQRCLYNVWSYLGREHLEALLDHLALVDIGHR